MDSSISNSVVTITSDDSGNSGFGTGFAIHQEAGKVFIMTCLHVVNNLGGAEKIKIGTRSVRVIASGKELGLDLAILALSDSSELTPLKIYEFAQSGDEIVIFGSKKILKNPSVFSREPIKGMLGDSITFQTDGKPFSFQGWLLRVEDGFYLDSGYSGSPIINQKSGYVTAIASHAQGDGQVGRAISTNSLKYLWKKIVSKGIIKSKNDIFYDDLKSAFNIDYNPLKQKLLEKKWEQADWYTAAVIAKMASVPNIKMRTFYRDVLIKSGKFILNDVSGIAGKIGDLTRKSDNQIVKKVVSGYEEIARKYNEVGLIEALPVRGVNNVPLVDLYTIDQMWMKYSDGKYGFSIQKKIWENVSYQRNEIDAFWIFCDQVGWTYKPNPWKSLNQGSVLVYGGKTDVCIDDNIISRRGCYPCLAITSCNSRNLSKSGGRFFYDRRFVAQVIAEVLSTYSRRFEDIQFL